ncbi:MAG: hypothetical protein D6755_10840 [Anaerolineae bacterium]|nr:MAG: hypothetical protein D6755_10840 [Anaerolineae bacterium]
MVTMKPATTKKFDDLAYAVLLLERQIDSYEKLHQEEIRALREALNELKRRLLQQAATQADDSQTNSQTKEDENNDEGTI